MSLLLLKQLRLAQNPVAYKNNSSVSITLAAIYLQGLCTQPALVQPVNTKVRQIHSSLGCE